MDIAGCFIDLEERDDLGNTFLLSFLDGLPHEQPREDIGLLLQNGANVHARNDMGRSCLHLLFIDKKKNYLGDLTIGMVETLKLLIAHGADVDSRDNEGKSVSEYAYSQQSGRSDDWYGDVWDRALSSCGYDICTRRRGFPRKPFYDKDYTREDFEELWFGSEEICPYYHDPPVWDPAQEGSTRTDRTDEIRDRQVGEDADTATRRSWMSTVLI